MITIDFTPEQIDALHHERFHHPHPRVQLKMEVVYLKSLGMAHHEICRIARITENTLRTYLGQFQQGGIERLKRTEWAGNVSELAEHAETLEDYFRKNPPRSTAEAAEAIERLTGVRRGLTQVRRFLGKAGLKVAQIDGLLQTVAGGDFVNGQADDRVQYVATFAVWALSSRQCVLTRVFQAVRTDTTNPAARGAVEDPQAIQKGLEHLKRVLESSVPELA